MGKGKKRKALDFQKTKLKVGKKLPKGLNVTDTSFKTKQIITPDQSFVPLADVPLPTLLNYLNNKSVEQKKQTLRKIRAYIADHKETLALYFPDILSKLSNAAMDSDESVPPLAVEVIITCLKLLKHVQYKAFSSTMNLHLNCMMTHGVLTVKQASLKVLESLLVFHPKVVTQEPEILFKLLNMISTVKVKGKGQPIRRLDDLVNSKITSYEWHQEVLRVVCLFLEAMMEHKDDDDDDNEEADEDDGVTKKGPSEIYWDGKTELYLPLYSAQGPVKVDMSWYASTPKRNDGQFEKFVFEVVELMSDVIKGELPLASRMQQEVILKQTDVKYLNLIVQILCYAGEFARNNLKLEADEMQKFSKRMYDIILYQLFPGFPYAQHGNVIAPKEGKGSKESECLRLNLGVCYLSAMFLLETEDSYLNNEREKVIGTLTFSVENSQLSDKSLMIVLKTSRILMKSKYINPFFKTAVMDALYGTLYTPTVLHQSEIHSFFMDLSLDRNYRDILPSKSMMSWFQTCFEEIGLMRETGKVNTKLLHYVRQMCCRKYPEFMNVLNNFKDEELVNYLCFDNEDFQNTIIQCIFTLDIISDWVLNCLSKSICENKMTLKMSIRLIHHLHTRYSRLGVTQKDQLLFVKFLLNTACDIEPLEKEFPEYEDTDVVMRTLKRVMFYNDYRIYPTTKWKTHQKIFEVCLELLITYYKSETANVVKALRRFAEIFLSARPNSIPVHTVLAFLLIGREIGYMYQHQKFVQMTHFLFFSCFLYISVITHKASDQARLYSVCELQKVLLDSLDYREVPQFINVNDPVFSRMEMKDFLYVLKLFLFLKRMDIISEHDVYIQQFFSRISSVCSTEAILIPVWRKIWTS